MTRHDYLNALPAVLRGLPEAGAERTIAHDACCFDEGLTAGQSDAEIARELDDPLRSAATVRNAAGHGAGHTGMRVVARAAGG